MDKTIDFLENADLQPKYVEDKKGRNPLSGIITILYLPLLFIYLYYSIQPQYQPLPSCCACASHATPLDSWIYRANTDQCKNSTECKSYIQKKLTLNCDATLSYLPIPDTNLTMNIASVGCIDLKPGDTCSAECLQVSQSWQTSLDYTNPDNSYQAVIRCPLSVGVCDFKAVYSNQETVPHGVCRYPELSGILTVLGSGLGLLNGLLITMRVMLRTFWNRIGANNTRNGNIYDYWKGVIIGALFNYFGILYLSLGKGVTKRMRYGGQLSMGFLIMFFKSPFVIYLVQIFSSFWTPIAILMILGFISIGIIIRTIYNLVVLEMRSRNCVVLSQGPIEHFGNQDEENPNENYYLKYYQQPERLKPVPYTTWRDFFQGLYMNIFSLVHLRAKSYRRYSGLKNGFYVSISLTTITLVWALLYGLCGWEYITYNFPFPLVPIKTNGNIKDLDNKLPQSFNIDDFFNNNSNDNNANNNSSNASSYSLSTSGSNDHSSSSSIIPSANQKAVTLQQLLSIAFLQSVYYVVSWALVMVIVFHFSLFLKYLPENSNFLLFKKKKHGNKIDYKFGFLVGIAPVVLSSFFFFYFEFYPYLNLPLPDSPDLCAYPSWTLVIPFLGLIPGFFCFIFAVSERFRSGVLSAIGVSILFFGMGATILLLNYCIDPYQDQFNPLAWFISLIGTFIIVYGSIRSDQILILDKKKENPRFLEEERLLSPTPIKNITEDVYVDHSFDNNSNSSNSMHNSILNYNSFNENNFIEQINQESKNDIYININSNKNNSDNNNNDNNNNNNNGGDYNYQM
ncbi:hypothetical protein DICPUDRAFT_97369 [Dictyostelium purpureum]|uniref:Uncharacterized protein n=1 Tax=Dictyostelium purpureum TaxID=5786 RepID=F0ZG55_DICPU|nr:uncharacterized protein DICPUDRAFT_97369 [Dictyostelium purpureum]EGC37042.1 hypothetical protein DICPUDRAFT_97369 [Dictyostelium purpureum]|eukprot:XP_003286399.1 hypothetical protein DICPUDRAFT_97369 [Dictyostelium purpureum]